MTDRTIPPNQRARARAAARMIPGFAIVDAPGQIEERVRAARNRRPTPQSRANDAERAERLRNARIGADRRLRGRNGDYE